MLKIDPGKRIGMRKKFKLKLQFSNVQIVALGYGLVILLGTILLLLPFASKAPTTFTEAFFTAVSATCVTGLVLVDTAMHWSLFGQIVILLLIQVGGLGFMTLALRFMLLLRRRVGLRYREVMVDSINSTRLGGILGLTKGIVAGTAFFEGVGAILLSLRFIPEYGFPKGLYFGVFHSISAFCNGGFDLMGGKGEFSSLVWYSDDLIVNLTIMSLIVIGGAGFLVWDDIFRNKRSWRRYHLQTKVVLVATGILLFGGAAGFLLLEWNNLGADMPFWEKLLTALFQSCTARTAGFNTIDTGALSEGSKILTMFLMFIGGSPGSTAGGIKTTTIAVMLLYTFASARHEQDAHFFGRSLEGDVLQKAVTVFMFNLLFVIAGALFICGLQPEITATDIFFETFSAMGTVGMSTGITRALRPVSCYIIIFLMYCGRVGSVSFAVAVLEKKARPPVTFPKEKITIG